jgi:hypothetical protein
MFTTARSILALSGAAGFALACSLNPPGAEPGGARDTPGPPAMGGSRATAAATGGSTSTTGTQMGMGGSAPVAHQGDGIEDSDTLGAAGASADSVSPEGGAAGGEFSAGGAAGSLGASGAAGLLGSSGFGGRAGAAASDAASGTAGTLL